MAITLSECEIDLHILNVINHISKNMHSDEMVLLMADPDMLDEDKATTVWFPTLTLSNIQFMNPRLLVLRLILVLVYGADPQKRCDYPP